MHRTSSAAAALLSGPPIARTRSAGPPGPAAGLRSKIGRPAEFLPARRLPCRLRLARRRRAVNRPRPRLRHDHATRRWRRRTLRFWRGCHFRGHRSYRRCGFRRSCHRRRCRCHGRRWNCRRRSCSRSHGDHLSRRDNGRASAAGAAVHRGLCHHRTRRGLCRNRRRGRRRRHGWPRRRGHHCGRLARLRNNLSRRRLRLLQPPARNWRLPPPASLPRALRKRRCGRCRGLRRRGTRRSRALFLLLLLENRFGDVARLCTCDQSIFGFTSASCRAAALPLPAALASGCACAHARLRPSRSSSSASSSR